jgi:lipopolysaccharide/colanic/teichoic acid biosynthesis glycosyltransferase
MVSGGFMKDVVQPNGWRKITFAQFKAVDEALCSLIDYVLACAGLLMLSPLFLVLGVVVKLDSPGPILYRRRVMGRNGTQFDAFKFRTMLVDGDAVLEANPELKAEWLRDQKLKDDPRITHCGRWMRKLSLDELPQLFNVLRGQMSLVGPRMISPPELGYYGDLASELLTVKPGITGLWQVSGRSDLDRNERVRLDMQYVRNRTWWLNMQLILMTIPAALKGSGAY